RQERTQGVCACRLFFSAQRPGATVLHSRPCPFPWVQDADSVVTTRPSRASRQSPRAGREDQPEMPNVWADIRCCFFLGLVGQRAGPREAGRVSCVLPEAAWPIVTGWPVSLQNPGFPY